MNNGYQNFKPMKDLSWIDEAWEASREAEQEDLLITIEQYYEYRKSKRTNSEGQSGQQGSAPGSDI
jgi:hypothetical protein